MAAKEREIGNCQFFLSRIDKWWKMVMKASPMFKHSGRFY
jgi:hypothetical protein